MTFTIERNDHHIGNALAPGQLVGVVLIGANKNHRSLLRQNKAVQVRIIREAFGQAQVQHVNQLVHRRRSARSAEDHFIFGGTVHCLPDNLAGLLTKQGSLGASKGGFGVGVSVVGQHVVANEVFDKRQRAPRGGVIRIDQRPNAKGRIDGGVITNNGIADLLDKIRQSLVCTS